jgi:hypothetical protein
VPVTLQGKPASGLYDPGSNISAMPINKFKKTLPNNFIAPESREFHTMSGKDRYIGTTDIKTKIFDIEENIRTRLLKNENFDNDILLGRDAIKTFRLNSDYLGNITQSPKTNANIATDMKTNENKNFINWNESIPIESFTAKTAHLDPEKQEKIKLLIDKYETAFAKNQYDIGTVSEHEAHIVLSEDKYVAKKPYRCSFIDQQEIESQVTELLK